jgi:hypothetical protein
MRKDGTVWAREGEVVDVPVDAANPADRTAASLALRGQHAKVAVAPSCSTESRGDRSMPSTVVRGPSTNRQSRKKKAPRKKA